MIDPNTDLERRRFPWALTRIELWGLVGAVGALFIGILLGAIWGPLFFIGLALMVGAILAFRTSERAPPSDAGAIVSPVDGVITSIGDELPPAELRLSGSGFQRIRVASSPASAVSIHAPMTGEILSLIEEAGDPNMRLARDPDEVGLANAYAVFGSGEDRVGIRVVTGGLGPRLDITSETGDSVRVGREIGFRRLGGWCDIWVPGDMALAVWPGMSLKAAETRLVYPQSMAGAGAGDLERAVEEAVPFVMPQLDPDEEDEPAMPEVETAEEAVTKGEVLPVEAEANSPDEEDMPPIKEDGVVKDASEQFARLRKKVEAAKKDDKD